MFRTIDFDSPAQFDGNGDASPVDFRIFGRPSPCARLVGRGKLPPGRRRRGGPAFRRVISRMRLFKV